MKIFLRYFLSILLNPFRQSIKYKLFLLILIVMSLPIVIFGLISYKISSSVIENDFIKYRNQVNSQIITNIDAEIKNLSWQSSAINSNLDDILYILGTPSEDQNETYLLAKKRTYNYFRSILEGNIKLNAITLISLSGDIVLYVDKQVGNLNLNTVEKEQWFKETLLENGHPILLEPHLNKYVNYRLKNNTVISISRAVVNLENLVTCGVLVLDESLSNFSSLFSSNNVESGEIFAVFSKSGEKIYSSNSLNDSAYKKLLLQSSLSPTPPVRFMAGKENMVVSFTESKEYGWKVISLFPEAKLKEKSGFIKSINNMLLVVLTIFSLFISIAFSGFVTHPLERLTKSFIKMQSGNLDVRVEVKGSDELAQISATFNNMVSSIKTLIQEKYQNQILRKQAELEALQSQINPHFLYNTLNSIRAVIDKRDYVNSSLMVESLSDIFRYGLNHGEYLVKLTDEIEHVRRYLFIQKFRFSDRYDVHFDIDREILNCNILRLTLQPLVENALHHGLDPKAEKGELRIAAKASGDKVYLYISDTGVGIPGDHLYQINSLLDSDPEASNSLALKNLGILNVNARIKFHFGKEYGLKLSGKPGLGTTVRITLPRDYSNIVEEQI